MLFKLAVARMSNPFKISYHVTFDPVEVETWSDIIGDMYYSTSRDISILLSNYLFFLSDQTFLLPSKGINQSQTEVLHMLYSKWQIINWDYQNYQIGKNGRMNFIVWLIWGKWEDIKLHIASSREFYNIHVYLIFF